MRLTALAAGALLCLPVAACSSDESPQAPPPPAVAVAVPLQQDVVDWDEYVGRFEAVNTVDVKPRVTGYLKGVSFRDGDYVRAGQTLFTVDARPAQAALDQARAQLARAEATLVNARTELARSRTLASSQAASTEEVEQRQAALRAGEADVNAARAAVRAQQLTVGFTRVTAPISGRVSDRMVDVGNSVTADQTVLTTIVSTDPIHFAFEGSEALLLKYLRQNAGSLKGTPVRIRLQDEADFVHAGRLDFVDNRVNTGAGTIRGRAVVPNGGNLLRPGMFGHMRLAGSRAYRGLLVPDSAIATDSTRKVVFVVAKDGTVAAKPVELGPLMGTLRVIRSGIAATDRVVISGLQRAMPGQKVSAKPGRIQPAAATTSAPAPNYAPPAAIAEPVRPAAGGR